MMINYKISELLKNQLDNSSHDKYNNIKNFLQELLNPQKNSSYHTEFQNFLGWIDSPEFMLKQLEGINNKMLALLAKNNIISLNDFADLSNYDLLDSAEGIFRSLELDENKVNSMIMKAREKWFADDKIES